MPAPCSVVACIVRSIVVPPRVEGFRPEWRRAPSSSDPGDSPQELLPRTSTAQRTKGPRNSALATAMHELGGTEMADREHPWTAVARSTPHQLLQKEVRATKHQVGGVASRVRRRNAPGTTHANDKPLIREACSAGLQRALVRLSAR